MLPSGLIDESVSVTATPTKVFLVAFTTRAYPAAFQMPTPTLSHCGFSWQRWTTATREAYSAYFSRTHSIQCRRDDAFQLINEVVNISFRWCKYSSDDMASNFEKLRRVMRRTVDSICNGSRISAVINQWSDIPALSLTSTFRTYRDSIIRCYNIKKLITRRLRDVLSQSELHQRRSTYQYTRQVQIVE